MVAAIAVHRPMTYEDYAALPDDGRRFELINGELVVAAAPNAKHLVASKRYYDYLNAFIEAGDLGMVFYAPYELKYSEYDAVQPDLFFVRRDRLGIVQLDYMTEAPDLVSETLSPSNWRYDLVTKAAIYARLGVREYWIIDPENETILVQVLRDGVYVSVTSDDGIARSEILPGFAIDPKVLFAWPAWMKS
jgi:Uma2 family endonuclease